MNSEKYGLLTYYPVQFVAYSAVISVFGYIFYLNKPSQMIISFSILAIVAVLFVIIFSPVDYLRKIKPAGKLPPVILQRYQQDNPFCKLTDFTFFASLCVLILFCAAFCVYRLGYSSDWIWFCAFLFLMTHSITVYFKVSDLSFMQGEKGKTIKIFIVFFVTALWSFFNYYLDNVARGFVTETLDIPAYSIAAKVTSDGSAWVIKIAFLLMIAYAFSSAFLLFPDRWEYGEEGGVNYSVNNGFISLSLLSISSALLFIVVFKSSLDGIYQSVFEKTVRMETRDTIFCNGEYQTVREGEGVTVRVLEVAKNEYRMISFYPNAMPVYRLECTDQAPWYRYTPVQTTKSLLEDQKREAEVGDLLTTLIQRGRSSSERCEK
ncbi:hypothetical protein [Entomohabitans teleogrylli]|uniref:hypothetical protein n=1 Tax=Entomohabitans teleogrylli TaxID=1384589 RepID=UPI00073D2FCD|nr:hypothetical protein [Entomohabitans teleogrylli]